MNWYKLIVEQFSANKSFWWFLNSQLEKKYEWKIISWSVGALKLQNKTKNAVHALYNWTSST